MLFRSVETALEQSEIKYRLEPRYLPSSLRNATRAPVRTSCKEKKQVTARDALEAAQACLRERRAISSRLAFDDPAEKGARSRQHSTRRDIEAVSGRRRSERAANLRRGLLNEVAVSSVNVQLPQVQSHSEISVVRE